MLLLEKYFQNYQACFGRSECEWVNILIYDFFSAAKNQELRGGLNGGGSGQ